VVEHPVLFNDEMMRAILAGLKTQTRRPIKPQPEPYAGGVHPKNKAKHPAPYIDAYCGELKTAQNPRRMSDRWYWWTEDDRLGPEVGRCPFGAPGDTLWLVEDRIVTVKRVWVERIRDISYDDCCRESGSPLKWEGSGKEPYHRDMRAVMETLWDLVGGYAKRGLGWDANPWVWACEWEAHES